MKCGFVGRGYELRALQRLTDKRTASMIVVTGRRRIGKSRLIDEFAKHNERYRHVTIAGLAPQRGITPAAQRSAFADQMQRELDLPPVQHRDWLDLLAHLAKATRDSRAIVLLDEVSWMGKGDPEFLPKLKLAWDRYFKENPGLILVLCGSVSSWLEKNILSSTGFVGRVSLHLRVEELSLPSCDHFWGKGRTRIPFFDKLKMLAITGGVPRYLEEIVAKESAEENIKQLCFSPEGILFREFDQIFSDLFDRRGPIYKRIVATLASGPCTMARICEKLAVEKSGVLSEYLEELTLAGFVHRDYAWDLKTREASKLSRFRLRDNYARFYLKCILPNRQKIQERRLSDRPVTALPGWDVIAGLQFENLVLGNRDFIWKQCGLSASEIEMDGPFFQQATKRRRGCQVDYLIQTRHGPLYLCEIKFSRKVITRAVEQDIQEKVERMATPRHCSVLPVLIHANKVTESVLYGNTFARIIDFSDILPRPTKRKRRD